MIDPVHMQNIVTRAPEVARVQRVQEGAPEAQSQVFAQELAKEAHRVEETVPSPPESPRTEWKREKRKKEEGEKRVSRGRMLQEKDSPEPQEQGELGRLIDTTA